MVAAGVNLDVVASSNRSGTLSRRATDLSKKLRELATERKAIILAHNYQVPELQEVADFLELGHLIVVRENDRLALSGQLAQLFRQVGGAPTQSSTAI